MHGRIYDPMLAEFLTPDPLMPNPSGHGINAFAYVENAPLDFTDPSGFDPDPNWADSYVGVNINGDYEFSAGFKEPTAPAAAVAAPTPAAGTEVQPYYFDSPADASDGADVTSAVSDAGTVLSAARAGYNFVKHLSRHVQRKPAPHSTAATAPGGSIPSAGRAGPSATQTRTEAPPSCDPDLGCPVEGAADISTIPAQRQPKVAPELARVAPLVPDTHEMYDEAAHGLVEILYGAALPEEKILAGVEKMAEGARAARGAKTAFEIAEAGGKHAGTLKNYAGRSVEEIQKAVSSYERQVAIHQAKIANPAQFAERWGQMSAREQAGLINKWGADAARNQELADVLRGLLGSR